MSPEAAPYTSTAAGSPRPVGSVLTPATPGVWAVSHSDIDRAQARRSRATGLRSSFELVTDVTFIWSYPAKSAFVTGTFSNWETTDPMTYTHSPDGGVWFISKALPPGDYQYKFIIDNVWRHAPDQPIAFDERGIINNVLSVTVEACGDPTCFCFSFFDNSPVDDSDKDSPDTQMECGVMTPTTIKRIQRNVGVAFHYVERDDDSTSPFHKTYMHTDISDRPFDCTVVNIDQLPTTRSLVDSQTTDGTISRVSSFENIEDCARYDPHAPVVADAAYAATLNDQAGSLPHTAPNRASALSSDPTELAYSVRARLSSPVLGFNPAECHDGIRLTDTNHCAVRVQERGLYKTVRGVLPLRESSRRVYYEFFIFRQATGGGVCIGLGTRELPLNCLCGTRPNSIGFSTSGNLIQTIDGKETWRDFGEELESGSTVGCLVSMRNKPRNANEKATRRARIEFYANGDLKGAVNYDFVGDLEVFPTLSLFAKHARVYSLFNGQDMLFASSLPMYEEITTLDGHKIRRDAGNTPTSLGLSTREGNGGSQQEQ